MSTVASIRFSDLLSLAWSSLRRNRLRSSLTIGAIAVGISVMLYLISLGYGLEQLTLNSVKNSNSLVSITVTPANAQLLPITSKVIDKMSKIDGVEEVMPRLTFSGTVSLDNQMAETTIVGVDPDYLDITDKTQIKLGKYFRKDDVQSMVVTTGFLKLFGLDENKTPLVLFSVELNKRDYPNLSMLENIAVTGVVDDSAQVVYLPRLYMEKQVGDSLPAYEHVKIRVTGTEKIESVRNELIATGFKVNAAVDAVQDISRVFTWIRVILASLGLIAVVVATIGMFNTLTISLLERTHEIGIMKALGVRGRDIRKIFIWEALLMGLCGGAAGIGLAILGQQLTLFIFKVLAMVANNATVPEMFNNHVLLILGSMLFAILIASVTGYYPARRAQRLKPIDAIRHE